MKILQITNSLATGGAEKLLLETIPLFNQKNIQMDLALLSGKSEPFLESLQKQNCCKIFFLGQKSVYNPILIFKIIPYLKKYELVHVHLFPSLYWVAFAKIFSFSTTKIIYTEHSTTNNRRNNFFFRFLDQIIYAAFSKIITISTEVDENIKKHLNFKSDKFCIIQNGINLKTVENQKKILKSELFPTINSDVFVLIQVASFRFPKDQKTVIKALKLLPKNVILALVGDGIQKMESEKLVQKLQLQERVFFLGNRMDVISLLKSADVVVLSSHHEGLSLSSIEGMASGRPFVASDVPGLGDVVRGAGILFPKNDEIILAEEIKKLANDSNYYNKTVTNCLKRASDFDIEITINKQINLYKQLLQK